MTRESLFKTLETLSGPNANTQIQSPQLHYTIKTAQFPQTALEFCQTQTEALNLIGEHKDCISGKIKNQTENRPVQHHQLREPKHRKTHYPDTLKNVLSTLPKPRHHTKHGLVSCLDHDLESKLQPLPRHSLCPLQLCLPILIPIYPTTRM